MKKIGIFFTAFLILFVSIPVGSESTTIYAPDGRTATVASQDVDAYVTLGWFTSSDEVVTTIYADDGRTAKVYKAEVPTYLALGWYENYADTVQELYAEDGRRITVYKKDVPAYLAVGWYETFEETIEFICAPGKTPTAVYKAQLPSYLELGWRRVLDASPMIALTFDDGPHGKYTDAILNILEKYDVKATFFVLGCQAELYPAQIKRAHDMGCDIGNHSYIHPNLAAMSSWRVRSEISKTNALINRATGENALFLRPPYGNHNATVRSTAEMPLVLWNVDPQDWNSKSAAEIANHVISYAVDGSIVLMHDIYPSTAEAVAIIVPALLQKGYRIVTVRELAEAKGVPLNNGQAYYGF